MVNFLAHEVIMLKGEHYITMNAQVLVLRSSLIYNTSVRHERHDSDTSDTNVTRATRATQVRHECYTNDTSATDTGEKFLF